MNPSNPANRGWSASHCSSRRFGRIAAAFALAFALLPGSARAQSIVQEYYVPMPEQQIRNGFYLLASGSSTTIESVVSLVVAVAGTKIIYDHWEDGYEVDIDNPLQSTTRIWGDGNDANGVPPGFANDPASFSYGAVIALRNLVPLPRNASNILYDGRDHVAATRGIVMSRSAWPTSPGALLADALEVNSTIDWGTSYVVPIGQDIVYPTPSTSSMFEVVGVFVMASLSNTQIQIDTDANGVPDITTTIGKGESYQVVSGVLKGATVTSNKPIQVQVMTGDINANYESRWFTLPPVVQFTSEYFAPVGTAADGDHCYIFLHNQNVGAITVNYATQAGSGSFVIPGNDTYRFLAAQNSAARFTSAGGETFFGVGVVGANPSSNNVHDWGFSLVPTENLTTEAVVGWGPGSDDLTQNGSPVWVTTVAATTLYVDYNGDRMGPLTDPEGGKYDIAYSLSALQVQRIYEPDRDQTGMRLYTMDGTLLTAAWGQDPAVAGPARPYLDVGTTIPNFPVPTIIKTSVIDTDAAPAGLSLGDTLLYSITLNNQGLVAIGNAVVLDTPPPTLSYVPNSTTRDGVPVADNGMTAFPLDEAGIVIPILPRRSSTTISYLATIVGSGSITNTATSSTGAASTHVDVVPPPAGATTCVAGFTDSMGSGVPTREPGEDIYVTIDDVDLDTDISTAQSIGVVVENQTGGDYETIILTETGPNTGVFRNVAPLATSDTIGLTPNDSTLNVAVGDTVQVVFVDPSFGDSCQDTLVISPPTETKYLYFGTDGAGSPDQDLDRVDPAAAPVDMTTAQTGDLSVATATITEVATSSSQTASATSLTFGHTVPAGSNRLLIVGVGMGAESTTGTAGSVADVTYNGVSLTFIGTQLSENGGGNGNDARVDIWYMVAPPVGTANVVVTVVGGTNRAITAGASTFTGVDQGQPFRDDGFPAGPDFTSATATNNSPSIPAITSAVGELVYEIVALDQGSSITTPGDQVELWNRVDSLVVSAASTETGAASVAADWSGGASQDWAAGAVSIRPATGGGGSDTATFTQTPVFCEDFTVPLGGVLAVEAYFSVISGSMPAVPDITATLRYGVTTIATSNATVSDGTKLTFGFPALGADATVPAGSAISLDIVTAEPGVTFRIDYDSVTAPSVITLPTFSVIHVDTIKVFDGAYPGGAETNAVSNGQTVYVRAEVGDPFGTYDITALPLAIDGPGVADDVSVTLDDPDVVNDTGCIKTYEYPWTTGATDGAYTITATAEEGTEGTIVDNRATGVTVSPADLGTPCTNEFTTGPDGADTTVYVADEQVCVRLTDQDENGQPLVIETVDVTVTATSGDSETFTVTETGANTGLFAGCIPASSSVVGAPSDGTLYAPQGTGLSATYVDSDDSMDTCDDSAAVPVPGGIPGISVVKTLISPADGQIVVGEQAQFRLRVTNVGSTTLNTIAVDDTFPSVNLGYVTANPTPDSVGVGTLHWNNVGPLTSGSTTDIFVTFTGLASIDPATNAVTVDAGGGVTDNDSAPVVVTNPSLSVVKTLVSPNPGPATIGDPIQFSVTVTNTGDTNIDVLPFEDSFSGSCFTYQSATPAPDGTGYGSITWDDLTGAGSLAPLGVVNISVTVTAAGNCAPATNTAAADFATDENGDTVPPASDNATITTLAASISGTVYDDEGVAGFGGGDVPIKDVVVRLYTDPNGDGDPSDGTLVGLQSTLIDGSYEFTDLVPGNYVVVETDPIGYETIDDISAPGSDNRIPVAAAMPIAYPGNDFLDDLIDPATYGSISGQVRYDTDVDGDFGDPDAGISGVTIDLYTDPNGDGNPADGILFLTTATDMNGDWAFPSVPPGNYVAVESDPLGFFSTEDADGGNDNEIAINVPPSGTSTGNDFLDSDVPNADLEITKSDLNDPVNPGGSLTYTILVENLGPDDADNVTVIDTLDANTTFVSSTGGCVEAPAGTLTCNLLTLGSGLSTSFNVTVTVSGGAPTGGTLSTGACTGAEDLCNDVTVSADQPDPDPSNNSSDEPTDVSAVVIPGLELTKSDNPDSVSVGGTLTYTLTYGNSSGSTITNATLVESYDPRTTFQSANPSPDAGNNVWLLGDLDPGETGTITIIMTVSGATVDGDILSNTAVLSGDSVSDAADTEETVVRENSGSTAALRVVKSASPTSIPSGGLLTWTVVVTNSGPATSYDTVVSDVVPSNLTYLNAVPTPDLVLGSYLEWNLGDLPAGASTTITVYTETDDLDDAGTLYDNCADAVGMTGPGTTSSSGLSAQGCGTASSDGYGQDCRLVMTKRGVGVAVPGGEIVYRCLWCDPCVDAPTVFVLDDLPPELEFISLSSRDIQAFSVQDVGGQQQVVIDVGLLPKGRAGIAHIRTRVKADVTPGTVLNNEIQIIDAAGRTSSDNDVMTTGVGTATQKSLPSVRMTGNVRAKSGGRVQYTTRYRNLPPGSSALVELSDGIDPSIVFPSPNTRGKSAMVWTNLEGNGIIKVKGTAEIVTPGAVGGIVSAEAMVSDAYGEEILKSGIDTAVVMATGGGSGGGSGGSGGGPSTAAKGKASLTAPRYGRLGLTTSLSLRYTKLVGASKATMTLPEGIVFDSALPVPSSIESNVLKWDGLAATSGTIKVKVEIPATLDPAKPLTFAASVTDTVGSVGLERDMGLR